MGLQRGYDMSKKEDVEAYIKNLGIEYRFSCYSEKMPDACHLLGDYLEAVDRDHEKARKVYEDNCRDRDFTHSCRKAGNYRMLGKGGEQDLDGALAFLKKACLQNDRESCFMLGELKTKTNPFGIQKNMKEGMNYLEKACNLDQGMACYNIASLHLTGSEEAGILRNMAKAFEYSVKACHNYAMPACYNVSQMYIRGEGVEKDEAKAMEYKQKVIDFQEQATRSSASLPMELGLKPTPTS